MNYPDALDWLYSTQLHGIKLGLENIRRIADSLHVRLGGDDAPRFLHVAGTNGKGSVCAMLDAICRAAGYRTALFTSPHLVTFRERIRLAGEMISESEAASGLTRVRNKTADWEHSPTFFEITTALALAWFQEHGAEVVVLETGMGGRLDATNVVTPAVSVITSIALDHQQWLGTTLAEIAAEKAGIIKENVPVVSVPQAEEVQRVLQLAGKERGALVLDSITTPWSEDAINLPGEHQRWNAALAVAALRLGGLRIPSAAVTAGLGSVHWPGRFQRISERFVLDGAHNPAAARQLAATWREIHGDAKAALIVGILRDKDVRGICEALLPIASRIVTVPVRNERTATGDEVAAYWRELNPALPCAAAPDLASAIAAVQAAEHRVLITGSLFLVGEAITHFEGGGHPPERSAQ